MSVSTNQPDESSDRQLTPVQSRYRYESSWKDELERASKWQRKRASTSHIEDMPFDVSIKKGETLVTYLEATGRPLKFEVEYGGKRYLASPKYKDSTRATYQSQRKCMDAWEHMKFPSHNISMTRESRYGTTLGKTGVPYAGGYSSRNFEFRQYIDGTGIVLHYDTIAAIRTRTNVVVNNIQDFGSGFARVTSSRDAIGTVPLNDIEDLIPDDVNADMFDITNIHTASDARLNGFGPYPKLVQFRDNLGGIVIIEDSTTKDRDSRLCGFYVDSEEINNVRTIFDFEDLLVPTEVKASGVDIVPVDEMNPQYGSSRYSDRGEVVQRQGEWFFIPVDSFTHEDITLNVSIPRQCECGNTSFNVGDSHTECKECGHLWLDSDTHYGWKDTLDSHEPTRYVPPLPTDSNAVAGYVSGTARHQRGEHYIGRFGDTWHKAVSHDRDVMVFDMDLSGTGGGARFD